MVNSYYESPYFKVRVATDLEPTASKEENKKKEEAIKNAPFSIFLKNVIASKADIKSDSLSLPKKKLSLDERELVITKLKTLAQGDHDNRSPLSRLIQRICNTIMLRGFFKTDGQIGLKIASELTAHNNKLCQAQLKKCLENAQDKDLIDGMMTYVNKRPQDEFSPLLATIFETPENCKVGEDTAKLRFYNNLNFGTVDSKRKQFLSALCLQKDFYIKVLDILNESVDERFIKDLINYEPEKKPGEFSFFIQKYLEVTSRKDLSEEFKLNCDELLKQILLCQIQPMLSEPIEFDPFINNLGEELKMTKDNRDMHNRIYSIRLLIQKVGISLNISPEQSKLFDVNFK